MAGGRGIRSFSGYERRWNSSPRKSPHEHGWFYHFVNLHTGAREWQSELSSIDTALFLGGVLTVRRCFDANRDIVRLSEAIYRRVDFTWMLNGSSGILSHGWKPESGFLPGRWDHYCELMILYLLGIGSPVHPIPAAAWRAWSRPIMQFEGFSYVSAADPLFVHQYSHAWIDFRGRTDTRGAARRLVPELGHGNAGAQGILSRPLTRVPRLHRERLGNHRV